MRRTVVLDIAGMTPALLAHAPFLKALANRGGLRALQTGVPAVASTVQATFLTGGTAAAHGVVGNGWYEREHAEIRLWRQAAGLVAGETVWEAGRRQDPSFTCANLFWQHGLYAGCEVAVVPRAAPLADGRQLADLHTGPAGLRDELAGLFGPFPLARLLGPGAGIGASRWIAAAARHVYQSRRPTLTLVRLPHLEAVLPRLGPDHADVPAEVAAVDALCGEIMDTVQRDGARVVVVSEYGVTAVGGAVEINRALRRAGLLAVREQMGREMLDPGASEAFAVTDHQLAHVYLRHPEMAPQVTALLYSLAGVDRVLDAEAKRAEGLDHPRAGALVALARPDRWFAYPYWLDDSRAPDYARLVAPGRKPGCDPAELFLDPRLHFPKLRIAWKRARQALGFRTTMDLVPLDPSLVRGAHGRPPEDRAHGPLLISAEPGLLPEGVVAATAVRGLILDHVFNASRRRLPAAA